MKTNFKENPITATEYGDLIGKTREEMIDLQHEFHADFIKLKKHSVALVAQWSLEHADTPEEAVVYAALLTKIYLEAVEQVENPMMDMLKKMLSGED